MRARNRGGRPPATTPEIARAAIELLLRLAFPPRRPRARRRKRRLDVMVAGVLENRSEEFARNVTANNELWKRLKSRPGAKRKRRAADRGADRRRRV